MFVFMFMACGGGVHACLRAGRGGGCGVVRAPPTCVRKRDGTLRVAQKVVTAPIWSRSMADVLPIELRKAVNWPRRRAKRMAPRMTTKHAKNFSVTVSGPTNGVFISM
eukprot:1156847-Prymnesium_polylepis.1